MTWRATGENTCKELVVISRGAFDRLHHAAIEYVTTPLPVPPRPELPSVSGEQLQCLSDETYTALVNRDRQRRDYAELLESIIQSTHTPQQ
ncbi:hypothetical protein [Marinobacter subterrani]|uniref:Uncharacterized protein n=1 Tax=Marinobacter subterrani TaxID=1658765 RepID=A0A0J7J778_9GAMM|nr:hypothetical protein [Marinobacter subterrani]KMQ73776.1 hypothetical protein Msub_20997 [Marinobacter subterrani]